MIRFLAGAILGAFTGYALATLRADVEPARNVEERTRPPHQWERFCECGHSAWHHYCFAGHCQVQAGSDGCKRFFERPNVVPLTPREHMALRRHLHQYGDEPLGVG